MNFLASSMTYFGYQEKKIYDIAPDIGIEIVSEYASREHWDRAIPKIMEGRTGKLSVHGPFVYMEIGDRNNDFNKYIEEYKRTFDLSATYSAIHCVVHSHGQFYSENNNLLSDAQKCCAERLFKLNEVAKSMGVKMAVENLISMEHRLLLEQEEFLNLLSIIPDINFLLDIGHAYAMHWDLEEVMKRAGKHITAFHVHDNDGERDLHLHVGEGNFDWQCFASLYKKYTPGVDFVFEYNDAEPNEFTIDKRKLKEIIC